MRARRTAAGLALVTSLTVAAPDGRAQVDLQWTAPPGCPTRDEVQDRIRALAGSSLDRTQGLAAEGWIVRSGGRFSLTLVVRDGAAVQKRVISSETCTTLGGAAAVTLALLLGVDVRPEGLPGDSSRGGPPSSAPSRGERQGNRQRGHEERRGATREDDAAKPESANPPTGAPALSGERGGERTPANAAIVAPPAPPAAFSGAPGSAAPASARHWALAVRGPIVSASVGPAPGVGVEGGLGVGVRYASWRMLLTGLVSRGQTISFPEQGVAAGVELQRASGQLAICRGWRWRRYEVAPCLGLAFEHMTARGFGQDVAAQTASVSWLAPSVGVVAHWYLREWVAVVASIDGYIELSRPRLLIEGLGEVTQLGPAAARASAALEWIF